jgi:biopolymer transport protein ExbB
MQPTEQAAEAVAPVNGGGLDVPTIVENFGSLVYVAIALLAVWGVYNAILLYRMIGKKNLPEKEAEALENQVRDLIVNKNDTKGAIEACMNPVHWHSSLAQLMAVGLKNRHKGLSRVKQILVMEFHTEVVGPMESRIAAIGTAAKMGPLLGLLGTVISMIAAFGRMSASTRPDPLALAGSISLGLWTTAAGLIVASPLMIMGNNIQGKLRKLRDRIERHLQDFVEVLEVSEGGGARQRAGAKVGAR